MEQDGNTMEKVKIPIEHFVTWNVEILNTDDYPWVLKPQRLADYNQFWMSQHMHLMPFRTRFLNELKESMSNNRTGDAHFRAWLTFPLLRRMHLERRRIAWRESLDPTVYSMATDPELDRPEPPVGNDPTIIQDPNDPTENVFVLDQIVGPLSRVDAFDSTKSNAQLIRRMEVSSWVLTNAIVVEMASIVFEATRLRENIEDDDANDESYLSSTRCFLSEWKAPTIGQTPNSPALQKNDHLRQLSTMQSTRLTTKERRNHSSRLRTRRRSKMGRSRIGLPQTISSQTLSEAIC
jgi:hypothetical protein